MTKYFVKNIETGETKEVQYRGGVNLPENKLGALFLPVGAELTNEGTLESYENQEKYIFDNSDEGGFVNNDVEQLDITGKFDIFKKEVAEESSVE